ncbi:MAG: flavodoxin family protein [Kiritimatiellia bacterium]
MKAWIVYESLWGNTAAIARAIAEGFGPDARAASTAEAAPDAVSGADLIVAGAPLFAFRLPTAAIRETIRKKSSSFPAPPNLSHPPMRAWLDALPAGKGRAAAFETRMWFSPGGATGAILKGLKKAGYEPRAGSKRFRVAGMYGPLKPGELERARAWGAALRRERP